MKASACILLLLLPVAHALAATPPPSTDPRLAEAKKALAADDALGAKIALNMLLEDSKDPSLRRAAQRMLDLDVAVAAAGNHVRSRELFLVEEALRKVERRLGSSTADQALRLRIAAVRQAAATAHADLQREDMYIGLAVRNLLETEKLFAGDYPLLREDAEKLLAPALVRAGNECVMIDWKPTLRGYRLLLQDKRSGDAFEVTSD